MYGHETRVTTVEGFDLDRFHREEPYVLHTHPQLLSNRHFQPSLECYICFIQLGKVHRLRGKVGLGAALRETP